MTLQTIDLGYAVWTGGSGDLASNWITGYVDNVTTLGASFVDWLYGAPEDGSDVEFDRSLIVLGVTASVGTGGILSGTLNAGYVSIDDDAGYVLTGDLTAADGVDVASFVTITGSDAALSADGLDVGYGGIGLLVISSGAMVSISGEAVIGDSGRGTIAVSGAGSTLTLGGGDGINDDIDIGDGGIGFLVISDGAMVSEFSEAVIGDSGPGTISVDGAGSTLKGGELAVGLAGPSLLVVSNGATVSMTYEVYTLGGGGTIAISGIGSSLTIGKPGFEDLVNLEVGDVGGVAGLMTISDGASVSLDGGAGVEGTLTISGAGSTLTVGGLLLVDNDGSATVSSGLMTIGDGAAVSAYGAEVGEYGPGTLTISGIGSNLTVGDDLGVYQTGLVMISNGGGIEVGSDIGTGIGDIDIGTEGGTATLTVSGVGSMLTTLGDDNLFVVSNGVGLLTIDNGGTIEVTGGVYLGSDDSDGASGTGTVIVSGIESTLTVDGEMSIDSGVLDVTDGTDVTIGGAVNLTGTSSINVTDDADVTIGEPVTLSETSSIWVDATSALEIGGSTNFIQGAVVVDKGKSISGAGTVNGGIDNNGDIVAVGSFTVTGPATGTGDMFIEPAQGDLNLNASVTSGQTVIFEGSAGVLRIADLADFAGTIDAYLMGYTVDLEGIAANRITFDPAISKYVLEQVGSATGTVVVGTIAFADDGLSLAVQPDGNGGTEIIGQTQWPTNPLVVILDSGADWSSPDSAGNSTYGGDVQIGLDTPIWLTPARRSRSRSKMATPGSAGRVGMDLGWGRCSGRLRIMMETYAFVARITRLSCAGTAPACKAASSSRTKLAWAG